jgi:heme/copper-type cytochrome/quinol oxidase subunit 2
MGRSRVALIFCAGVGLVGLLCGLVLQTYPQLGYQVAATAEIRQFVPSPVPRYPQGPIRIKATGHKFFWRFCFCGNDQTFGTPDDLVVNKVRHLPLDSDVQLIVESDDFVYSFHVPKLKLRHIAVPELSYNIDFHTEAPGNYAAIMDPACGAGLFQDQDMGHVVIEPRKDFEAWYLKNYRKTRS